MKKIFLLAILFLNFNIFSQTKSWDQIDARQVPQWWTNAKFGIFIHWGPYSVPSFSQLGEYSEWYWKDLVDSSRKPHNEVTNFHNKNFGKSFTYPDFVPKFKAELFNPDDWAKLFERSGAKYVVLTSKHHDGYTLWQSKEADMSWGRPWNSVSTGPQRDLLGDLTKAVRKTNVKMGIYYSLYEWYNPLYTANPNLFVDKHLIPQFKDVVERYSPSIIFTDGEWEHTEDIWKSKDILTWLYNESSVKNEVVVNDRWGKDTRHHHGGYYTTEYGSGLNTNKPWEENRGMAHSFGYSRTENLKDYNSSQKMVYMLIDIVSRGGNFLLDIGPAADGTIPVIMQERLTDIGNWLSVNGEAIYDTKSWKNSCQWSSGKIQDAERGSYKTVYDIMKLTVEPDAGAAVKEIFFTQKKNDLYAITPIYPDKKLVIKNLKISQNAIISLIGLNGSLNWKQVGDNVEITVPTMNPSKPVCNYAFVFKISGLI
jgi:alpha-L-fucosidase